MKFSLDLVLLKSFNYYLTNNVLRNLQFFLTRNRKDQNAKRNKIHTVSETAFIDGSSKNFFI